MPGKHKNPTISFRVSDYERRAIEENIKMSGMLKKDYFVRSCIYNRVCVVGKKETIYPLVAELRKMQEQMAKLGEQFKAEGEIARGRICGYADGLPAPATGCYSDAGWRKVSVGGRQRKETGIKQV